MSELSIARRYAGALYEEAEQAQRTAQVDADVDMIRASLDGSRELVRFFGSPVIPRAKKLEVVEALFDGRVEPLTLRFLRLLVEKRREDLFPEVIRAYRGLRDERLGLVEAQARVALPLDEAEKQSLTRSLEALTGKRVRLQLTHDASLLGGMVVRVGDMVYDGSVRNKLMGLRERLMNGTHNTN